METKEITLNDKKYLLTKWNAIDAFKLQVKVTKLIGSSLGGINNVNMNDLQNLMQMDVVKLVQSIGGILDKVNEDDFINLVTLLLSKNIQAIKYAEGNEVKVPLNQNSLEILEMYELSFAVLELNLGKFIDGIKSKFSSQMASKKKGN